MARSGAMFRLKDTTRSGTAKPLIWIKLMPSLPLTLRRRCDLEVNRKLRSRKRDCLAVCPPSCRLQDQVDGSHQAMTCDVTTSTGIQVPWVPAVRRVGMVATWGNAVDVIGASYSPDA